MRAALDVARNRAVQDGWKVVHPDSDYARRRFKVVPMRVLFQHACVWLLVPVFTATLSAQTVLSWRALPSGNSGPSPRRGVVGVYDEASDRLVFQGAETANRQFFPDVWFFDLGSNT